MSKERKKGTQISVADKVWDKAEEIAQEQGLELVDIEYVKEAGQWILRVFIDREQGVDHACCSAFSQAFGDYLDQKDPIPVSYVLEVSSPGLERPLKKEADFHRFAGRQVIVSLYAPLDGKKEYRGELLGLEEGKVLLKSSAANEEEKIVAIPKEQIGKARLEAFIEGLPG